MELHNNELLNFINGEISLLGLDWWERKIIEFKSNPFLNNEGDKVEFVREDWVNNPEDPDNPINEENKISFDIIEYGLDCNNKLNGLNQLSGWPHNEYELFEEYRIGVEKEGGAVNEVFINIEFRDFNSFGIKLMDKLRQMFPRMKIDGDFLEIYDNILFYINEEIEENISIVNDEVYNELCKRFLKKFKRSFENSFKIELNIARNCPKKIYTKINLSIMSGDFAALVTSLIHLGKVEGTENRKIFIRNICDTYKVNSKDLNFGDFSSAIRNFESGSREKKSLINLPSQIRNLSDSFLNNPRRKKK